MIKHGDFYWIPILPKEMRSQPKKAWPKEFAAEYRRLRSAFTASKGEFMAWARKDRHQAMTKTAKAVLAQLVDCLNFDSGRCDPSQQTIADELGMSLRSVERAVRSLVSAGWVAIARRGMMTTNFYRLRVPVARIEAIQEDLSARKLARQLERQIIEPEDYVDNPIAEKTSVHPSKMADHDPTELAVHYPTKLADKPMNRTSEDEPVNKEDINQREGNYRYEVGDREEEQARSPRQTSAQVIDLGKHLPRKAPAATGLRTSFGRRE